MTPARTTPILELMDLHAAYGGIEVLRGVDLVVPRGSVVALLGPNGAGKTTLLRAVSGHLRPTSGHVHLAGTHVNGASAEKLARAGLCTIPEGRATFPGLTVLENLRLVTYASVAGRDEVLERAFARFPRLAERRGQLAGTLSGGEQRMLAMARALGADPALLLLDEPSMGLAPLVVDELYEVIAQLSASGVAVLVVEQFAGRALGVAEYAAVMRGGRVVAMGEPADVQDELPGLYLGRGLERGTG
ncbi:MAG: ATP-binding cassette domain-containing protein [Streptosporangiales bacterium]|nr:ATP-binding cassette domain-containing protein [Streptosporangiales bacterium]